MVREETPREKKYLEIITWLNEMRRQVRTRLFDCGELGIALIYWGRNRWEVEWFDKLEGSP